MTKNEIQKLPPCVTNPAVSPWSSGQSDFPVLAPSRPQLTRNALKDMIRQLGSVLELRGVIIVFVMRQLSDQRTPRKWGDVEL